MTMRREVLITLGAGLAWPLAAIAQPQAKQARIGLLRLGNRVAVESALQEFKQGLRDLGYVEGKNLVLEMRFADGKAERLPALAAELVQLKVDLIVTTDTQATRAAKQATTVMPIVMANIIDPVGSGFVKDFARPGGNITGIANLTGDLSPKHLELLMTAVPKLSAVGLLLNPANSGHRGVLASVQAAAAKAGIRVIAAEADTPQKIDSAFAVMAQQRAGAVIVAIDGFFFTQAQQIVGLAAKHRLPSISSLREFGEAGLLLSYGQSLAANWRHSTIYVDKILKGAKPADLPVELPMRFYLVVNNRTGKTLGIAVPKELLLRADEVIQ